MIVDIIMTVLCIIAFLFLWRLVKWVALIALIGAVIMGVKVYFDSKEVRKEIEKDPDAYYNNLNKENENDKNSN